MTSSHSNPLNSELGQELEQQLAHVASLDARMVRDYLLEHPDFFAHHPELLLTLRLSHQQKGSVSLIERQQETMRQRMRQLEEEITNLMTVATRNEQIFRFNSALCLELLKAKSRDEILTLMRDSLQAEFAIRRVEIVEVEKDNFGAQKVYQHRLIAGQYFGRLSDAESQSLFRAPVGSVALLKLDFDETPAILAFAHDDPAHFHSRMDSLLLDQLRQQLNYQFPLLP
ncbi:DUF484 family protein [Paraferrimonas sedimenticola]|uniref:DUF484 domain-containing protein n=1 Tax=Paraferrimonas sedimenticola TaxID=375674 RepID=A0AA37RY68_9GAMM|nr:DUF484 family protein [Paraferrimonas sedimenticola]GLP97474.1 DUF484 domain-containing protein [Paraferrimonas sedimenticola]